EVAILREWITRGAPDPREETLPASPPDESPTGKDFWAYQPPRQPSLPSVRDADWARGAIDQFILAQLEGRDLTPAPDAHRAALLRRVYFDLIGLPPSPEEIQAFVDDPSPQAFERVVDHLLRSPQFGERWGRHWLDVARFAESVTLRGLVFENAWRY